MLVFGSSSHAEPNTLEKKQFASMPKQMHDFDVKRLFHVLLKQERFRIIFLLRIGWCNQIELRKDHLCFHFGDVIIQRWIDYMKGTVRKWSPFREIVCFPSLFFLVSNWSLYKFQGEEWVVSFMTTLDSLLKARCMWSIETLSLPICCWDRDPQSGEIDGIFFAIEKIYVGVETVSLLVSGSRRRGKRVMSKIHLIVIFWG